MKIATRILQWDVCIGCKKAISDPVWFDYHGPYHEKCLEKTDYVTNSEFIRGLRGKTTKPTVVAESSVITEDCEHCKYPIEGIPTYLWSRIPYHRVCARVAYPKIELPL